MILSLWNKKGNWFEVDRTEMLSIIRIIDHVSTDNAQFTDTFMHEVKNIRDKFQKRWVEEAWCNYEPNEENR